MRRTIASAVAFTALLAGAPGTSAAAPSGIRGGVIKSPTTPVCQEGVSCNAPAAGIVLIVRRSGRRVATVTTSDAGTYRVVLRPGTYVVHSLRRSMFGSLLPRTVRVLPGRSTVASFEIDTGVR